MPPAALALCGRRKMERVLARTSGTLNVLPQSSPTPHSFSPEIVCPSANYHVTASGFIPRKRWLRVSSRGAAADAKALSLLQVSPLCGWLVCVFLGNDPRVDTRGSWLLSLRDW